MVLREWARDAHATVQAVRAAVRHVADDPSSLGDDEWLALLGASGAELDELCALADDARRTITGDELTFVVNRNLDTSVVGSGSRSPVCFPTRRNATRTLRSAAGSCRSSPA